MPSSYSTCPGLSIKWTGRRLVTDSGTKCAWVIHESKAVQIHVYNNRRCLDVPRVPGSVKNPHNHNNVVLSQTRSPVKLIQIFWHFLYVTQLPGSVKNLNIIIILSLDQFQYNLSEMFLWSPSTKIVQAMIIR